MRTPPSPSTEPTRTIGQLCVGGDWACAHGDLAALRHVARSLAGRVPEPIRRELHELAAACLREPERAGALWARVKAELPRASAS